MPDRLKAAEDALRAALAAGAANGSGEQLLAHVDCRALVRNVLEAFREPTSGMIEAGSRIHELEGDRIDITPELPAIWQAMIDAALGAEGRPA